ncbi:class I SAM-dependent methyltransferase [Chiayiivirga flava]|uniref:SAM-dependent methyltransferase n=1 Tax=Chiayiivirga flava TaxID=659595 RepID=A0A7W8FZZ9_9GAMM|nr:class I SAM-dependent methyltransferase [Chiayiivirga flava]MBB5208972.1 SAM-dependent methyltransferase [Chiayiivirga flava]
MTNSIQLEPTSERLIEEDYRRSDAAYAIYIFHLATYALAEAHAASKLVLDLGCGSGYGSRRLADRAKHVVAVDVAADAISYARERYGAPNLDFSCIDPEKPLPFEDNHFDLVCSFQVIEHVKDVERYLREMRRVMRPDGLAVIVTPDRRHRLFRFQKPWNPWHLTEYSKESLEKVISRTFGRVEVHTMGGSSKIMDPELSRCRRIRNLTLPLTLKFVPERIRIWALRKAIAWRASRARPSPTSATLELSAALDVTVGPNTEPAVNLVAYVRK